MRPLIALICGTHKAGAKRDQPRDFVNRAYSDAVRRAGAAPLLVPLTDDPHLVRAVMAPARGLLITGGVDIHPSVYGEDVLPECGEVDVLRDATDRAAMEAAAENGLPMLGICRGIQSMAAFLGGTLYQDIPSQVGRALPHRQKAPRHEGTHIARITPGSLLAEAVGDADIAVNTFHHQAVRDVPPGFRASAEAPDGVIEAIEAVDGPWRLGVQWHPEEMAHLSSVHQSLFNALVAAVGGR